MNRHFYRFILAVVVLALAVLACDVPDSWVDVIRHLPTLTPTPAPLTLYVATTGNDSNDCLSVATACLTIYNTLRRATRNSTVHIGAGTFEPTSPIEPHYGVTFIGAGVDRTILSYSSDVIQLVYPTHVEVSDLTISGPDSTAGNGIELRNGAALVLQNCHIHDKNWGVRLTPLGAASTATITNCRFDHNSYAITNNRGNLTVTGSTITLNQLGLENSGTAQVTDTNFTSNGATDTTSFTTVPAIENGESLPADLTITGGSVSNNLGVGILSIGGNINLSGTSVNANTGIGVWQQSGSTTIATSLIQNNSGDGLEIGGRSGIDPGLMNISRTAITGNHGAGLRIDDGEIHIQNSTISSNLTSGSGGGGIWGYGGNLFLLDSTVAYNTGHGLQLGPGTRSAGSVTIMRSVVALNSTEECQIDSRVSMPSASSPYVCSESWTRLTLKLQPLVAEAGTFVHPLAATSPLVDAGGPLGDCPATDQRGYRRPAGSTCDVGAYEYGTTSAAIVIATPDEKETATPDIILLITDTPTPAAAPLVTLLQNANCRKGPGIHYDIVTGFEPGKSLQTSARNQENTWVQVQIPTGDQCWLAISTLDNPGPLDFLPVLPAPPLPDTPASFSDKGTCNPQLKTRTIQLSWSKVANATGYHLYRNGVLLAGPDANVNIYSDTISTGKDYKYELEAINAYGASERLSTTVLGCN